MNSRLNWGLAGLLATAVGCASTPQTNSQIDALRDQYVALSSLPNATQYASTYLRDADKAIGTAAAAVSDDPDDAASTHALYMAKKRLEIAGEVIEMKTADSAVAGAESQRQQLLIANRTQEAEMANQRADRLENRAEAAEALADEMASRAADLEESVANLTTKETDRGLVLTLGDILFESGSSNLKPGAELSIGKVAEFLRQYQNRSIMIEGFTDSQGSDSYNQQLSERRANSVKQLLVSDGIPGNRVMTKGYGESYPVADNGSSAGRLQNRRVEIIIGNDTGAAVANRRG